MVLSASPQGSWLLHIVEAYRLTGSHLGRGFCLWRWSLACRGENRHARALANTPQDQAPSRSHNAIPTEAVKNLQSAEGVELGFSSGSKLDHKRMNQIGAVGEASKWSPIRRGEKTVYTR